MRDQIRGVSYAAIAAAAMLLSFAAGPAQGQGMPGGSYLQSCTNVRMDGEPVGAPRRAADRRAPGRRMPARGRRLGAHGTECRWLCWWDRQHERPADLQLQRWARVRIVLRPAFAGPVLRLSAVLRIRPLAKRVAKAEPRPRGRGSVPFVNRRLVAVPVAVAVPVGIAAAVISAPAGRKRLASSGHNAAGPTSASRPAPMAGHGVETRAATAC